MRRTMLIVVLSVAGAAVTHSQSPATPAKGPAFEVASIKRTTAVPTPGPNGSFSVRIQPGSVMPGGRWQATNVTLMIVLWQIYPEYRQPNQIVGGPEWLTSERFDINAKAEGEPSSGEITQMVKQLLADRFALRTHTETRSFDTYALVLARSDGRLGPGMKKPAVDCRALASARARGDAPPARPGERPSCSRGSRMVSGLMQLTVPDATVGSIIGMLQATTGRAIVDRTGLTDRYDIELNYAFTDALSVSADGAASDSGLTIFGALQGQLGLKLEPRKEQAEVLVIDHVEMPTPD
jgi:uncharacterized protein (TIGR03435 family)